MVLSICRRTSSARMQHGGRRETDQAVAGAPWRPSCSRVRAPSAYRAIGMFCSLAVGRISITSRRPLVVVVHG